MLKKVLIFVTVFVNFNCLSSYNKDHLALVLLVNDSEQIVFERLDLSGANLQGKNLSGKKFINVNFNKARLEGAIFRNSVFYNCTFREALIRGAKFRGAGFMGCNLVEVNFSNWISNIVVINEWTDLIPNKIIFDDYSTIGMILGQPEKDGQVFSKSKNSFSGNGESCAR